jgi:hypothetical protein
MTTIKHQSKIREIMGFIGDCKFDMDQIHFDSERAVLTIAFEREDHDRARMLSRILMVKKLEIPIVQGFFKILHVNRYSIEDTVKIGIHTITDLEFDASNNQLKVITAAPSHISITVDTFELSIELTDDVISKQIRISLL